MSTKHVVWTAVHAVPINPDSDPPSPEEIAEICLNLTHPAIEPLLQTLIEHEAVNARFKFRKGLEYRCFAMIDAPSVLFVYQWRQAL
jgi:hypothetical protein